MYSINESDPDHTTYCLQTSPGQRVAKIHEILELKGTLKYKIGEKKKEDPLRS